MTLQKTLALTFGLSLASLLAACNGSSATDTAAKAIDKTATEAASKTISTVTNKGAVTMCPDDKILGSQQDYNAVSLDGLADDFETWHAENGKREGVKTTETGLQYKVVQKGLKDGVSPIGREKVTVHYHGYFPDGKVFDSSYERGETIDFPSNAVIKGWIEALQDMKTCEARTLYIPGDLAYGPRGRPGIAPNATLLFNVQLIGVNKKK